MSLKMKSYSKNCYWNLSCYLSYSSCYWNWTKNWNSNLKSWSSKMKNLNCSSYWTMN
ncbi:MAG: hypothetical protein WC112_08720 [Proteiniphilum sp.]